jgi:hypothetical protein
MKNIINKAPKIIGGLSLIIGGWYLEIHYYRFTFNSIGLNDFVSKVTALALCILLGYFAYYKKTVKFCIVLAFSIGCTLLGQSQSFESKKSVYDTKTLTYTALTTQQNRYTLEIKTLNTRILNKESMLPDSVQGMANWKTNGVDPIKKDIELLTADKKEYEVLLNEVIHSLSTTTRQPTLFENISKDIPFISSKGLQYAFMISMSVLIALLAPSGITLISVALSTTTPQPKKRSRVVEKGSVEKSDKLSVYVNSRFDGNDMPSVLKSRKHVVDSSDLSYGEFNSLSKRAVDLGLISVQGNKSVPTVNKSKFEMMLRNRQGVELKVARG